MNKVWIFVIISVVIIIVSFLWWIFYPIFRVIEVNDELPIEITAPSQNNQIQDTRFSNLKTYEVTETTNDTEEETNSIYENIKENKEDIDTQTSSEKESTSENHSIETKTDTEQVSTFKESDTTPVVGVGGHNASGSVKIITQGEKQYIRYEDFSTTDGPELRVYLSRDLDAKDYIDLGLRKGTRGNINYSVPENIDISDYKYVLHWCRPFRVLFNYADIGEITSF